MPSSTSVTCLRSSTSPPTPSRAAGPIQRLPIPRSRLYLHPQILYVQNRPHAPYPPFVPTKPNRTERILLRSTPGEKTRMAERAAEAGLSLSAWIRRAAMEGVLPAAPPRRVTYRSAATSTVTADPDYELRVRQTALRMPRKTAERLVRREMEAEAKAA